MGTWQLVLEYFKALLSPQVVAGIFGVIVLVVFREDIKGLMRRVARIRLPGGSEFSTSQAERASEVGSPTANPPLPKDDVQVPLPQGVTLTPEQLEQIRQVYQAERARAYLWEYRYLNYFLVFHTQRVLDWLASLQDRPTFELYDNVWLPAIPSTQERKVIMDVLQAHHLVQLTGPLIEITPKGREYVQWRGPLAPAT